MKHRAFFLMAQYGLPLEKGMSTSKNWYQEFVTTKLSYCARHINKIRKRKHYSVRFLNEIKGLKPPKPFNLIKTSEIQMNQVYVCSDTQRYMVIPAIIILGEEDDGSD